MKMYRFTVREIIWIYLTILPVILGDGEAGTGMDSMEQHFSDWSDNDSDDDILNQPEQVWLVCNKNIQSKSTRRKPPDLSV